jgi:hypothetical protein
MPRIGFAVTTRFGKTAEIRRPGRDARDDEQHGQPDQLRNTTAHNPDRPHSRQRSVLPSRPQ